MSRINTLKLTSLVLYLNKYYFTFFIIALLLIFLSVNNLESSYSIIPFVSIFTKGIIPPALITASLQFTFFSALLLFIINIFPNIILSILYFNGNKKLIDILYSKNKLLVHFMGYYSLNPFAIEAHIRKNSSVVWKLAIFFMHGLANFTLIYFLFGWSFANLRSLPKLIDLISNNIFSLFFFNIVLFVFISTLFLGFCFICMLSIASIFHHERK